MEKNPDNMNENLAKLIERYPCLESCGKAIQQAGEEIIACFERGGKLLICGNGGSCADSEHIVGELMKGFLKSAHCLHRSGNR